MGAGRPTEYNSKIHPKVAAFFAGKGYTLQQMAEGFGVHVDTICEWKNVHPEFSEAIKSGKEAPDDLVERSLYERATGYTYQSEKIFQYQGEPVVVPCVEHVPPDTTAQIFWLKNRRPKQWRDKQDIELSGDVKTTIDTSKLTDEQKEAIARIGLDDGLQEYGGQVLFLLTISDCGCRYCLTTYRNQRAGKRRLYCPAISSFQQNQPRPKRQKEKRMNFESKNTTEYEQPTKGTKPARLVGLYDIGVQQGKAFNGEPAKDRPQVIFVFELVGKEKQSDGRPFLMSKFVTVSLHKKGNLVPILKAFGMNIKAKNADWWEAPSKTLDTLLGEPIMLSIEVDEETKKASIASISAPIDGMVFSEPTEKLGFLDLDAEDYLDYYTKAPEWVQKMCQKSIGWADR